MKTLLVVFAVVAAVSYTIDFIEKLMRSCVYYKNNNKYFISFLKDYQLFFEILVYGCA